MHIQLDTCAIGDVLDDGVQTQHLASLAAAAGWRLSISAKVLDEMFAMDSARHQLARAAGLLLLHERLGASFFVSHNAIDHWRLELSRKLGAPAPIDAGLQDRLFVDLQRAVRTGRREEACLDYVPSVIKAWKQARAADLAAQCVSGRALFLSRGWSVRDIGRTLDGYSPQRVLKKIFEEAIHGCLGRSRFDVHILHLRERRFLSLRAWAALAHLIKYSELLPSDRVGQHVNTAWLKPHPNDWFDAEVAAAAAYADIFVTGDGPLRGRCQWLREHRCIRFETVTLAELLSRGSVATG